MISDLYNACFDLLVSIIMDAEILYVLKDMDPNVSPDSNGYGAYFSLSN